MLVISFSGLGCKFWEQKKTHKKKTRKQNFHGILFRDFGGDFVYVFFLLHKEWPKKTHKQNFGTHPVPGQSRQFVYVYVFFVSLKFGGDKRFLCVLTTKKTLHNSVVCPLDGLWFCRAWRHSLADWETLALTTYGTQGQNTTAPRISSLWTPLCSY